MAPATTMDSTNLSESVNTQVADGYDYRLDDANVLNYLRPDNETCIFHSLGDATFEALRTRPMGQAETDQVMHCFAVGPKTARWWTHHSLRATRHNRQLVFGKGQLSAPVTASFTNRRPSVWRSDSR